MLNSSVPGNCKAQLNQPISCGRQPKATGRRLLAAPGGENSPALADWKSCRYAAVVKGIEPAKKIMLTARLSSDHACASPGARLRKLPRMNREAPSAKIIAIHQFNCPGIHKLRSRTL